MKSIFRITLILMISLGFIGCDLLGTLGDDSLAIDDSEAHRAVEHGIEVLLETPESVRQHQPFQIEYHLINHRSSDVTISTGHSCPAWLSVRYEGEPAEIQGGGHGCLTVVTDHHIAAGDTATQELSPRAELSSSDEPAEPGTYTVKAKSDVYRIAGEQAELPTVERQFEIRE